MVIPELDPGLRVLAYAGLIAAVPLSFLLLFRLLDYIALDGYVEQYRAAPPEPGREFDRPVEVGDDEVRCPRCGEHNETGFTFCRSCQAQIGA